MLFIKKMWRKIVPDHIKAAVGKCYIVKRIVCYHDLRVRRYGNLNPQKKYFVIKTLGDKCGIFSLIFTILPSLDYSEKRKAIPVVDFHDTYMSMIQNEDTAYQDNSWTYYFEQPVEQISLDEVYQSQNVILDLPDQYAPTTRLPNNWYDIKVLYDKKYDKWGKLIRKYIKLQPELQNRVDQLYTKLFPRDKKVLGIGIRAGYRYLFLCKHDIILNHPLVPTCEDFIKEIEKVMKKWNYSKIFLSVDDWEYREKIVNYFGKQAIYMDRELRHYFKDDKPVEGSRVTENIKDIRKTTEEYIVETYLLSRCNGLFSSLNTTSEFAFLLNGGKYEHCEFYDQGLCKAL